MGATSKIRIPWKKIIKTLLNLFKFERTTMEFWIGQPIENRDIKTTKYRISA